ncbi:hypothetical protein AB0K18_05365 [Nonomuraea sp. NPDC049421]|uniref:hypothetical protein n=1 Tax=Nonomuraea sp. NPDC049421 TaxID=3155275 RepID=UPI0034297BB3
MIVSTASSLSSVTAKDVAVLPPRPLVASFLSSSARSLIALRSSSEKPSVLITVTCLFAVGGYVLMTLTLPYQPALLDS